MSPISRPSPCPRPCGRARSTSTRSILPRNSWSGIIFRSYPERPGPAGIRTSLTPRPPRPPRRPPWQKSWKKRVFPRRKPSLSETAGTTSACCGSPVSAWPWAMPKTASKPRPIMSRQEWMTTESGKPCPISGCFKRFS